ncbi:MAG: tyrosine-type recombinase/integrase [Solirubrobacteraceae bacterium]|nr:MAG: hypothetical protein DLM63_00035 [Solirubrobacterales bacterium]
MADRTTKTRYPGVYQRHRKDCRRKSGCDCPYRASVYVAADDKNVVKRFALLRAAVNWRNDAQSKVQAGTLRAPTAITIREAADELVAGMRDGSVFTRSGRRYKPATIRGYERTMRLWINPELGDRRLSDVRRRDVQKFADRIAGEGLTPSTVQNIVDPLRVIYRRAVRRDVVVLDPTEGLELRRPDGKRDRIASPDEAQRLLDAIPDDERALWATAVYAGLRRGELRGLRWEHIDLAAGRIAVRRAWDDIEGDQGVKSDAGRRTIPILAPLRLELVAHKLRTGRDGPALVFGITETHPFDPSNVRRRALAAWKAAELLPIGLHECRHTFASLMIASGANAKVIQTVMGHATISMTFDRYGHLMPGGLDEAAAAADAYLLRADGA